ncbi:MAG: hypothetical protein UU11_C0002G0142 [Parcubacteria group bacterium GW2011_GWF2_40_69]|nr:MAG: hypothetical protein UT25_C0002G0149 [Parcubacteria group bacterium GW2011_GWC1_39_12]KKR19351.1 MAG: hypothetical protein UT49_C0002G0197 [Parcubacteria group bacterium GW2011_GWF1_39_37]KKR35266.1 MAG: hypothetical protein UT68_C0004G0074 [Parcubacteria group bacterium GW2011_GWC2_40_10]KKR52301.1 MAG: hypothetical protein UT89_C0002G0102 [Parcubacteria group bacterium GW2011_GWE1_40_20]KKR69344.1 MAG: hypothetical protein UU11_C0002G0142 [Parcubacteria group bacterium GW2011_GWF2_40_
MTWEHILRRLVLAISYIVTTGAVLALGNTVHRGGSREAILMGVRMLALGVGLATAQLVVDRVLVRFVSRVAIRAFGVGFAVVCVIAAPSLWKMGMPVASGITTFVGLFSVVAATIEQ